MDTRPRVRPRSAGDVSSGESPGLHHKGTLRRVKKISNAHIFEAVLTRGAAHRRIIDDLLSVFGGRSQPVMAHLIDAGKLTLDDLREAEEKLRSLAEREHKK